MICPSCGEEQPDQAKFCNECGNPLLDTERDLLNDSQKQTPTSAGQQRRKILILSLIVGGFIIVIILLVFVLAVGGNNVAGKYYDNEGFAFELKPDGTVSYSETDNVIFSDDEIGMMGGTYTTDGNKIIIELDVFGAYENQIVGTIDDDRIIIDGEVYTKR
jgi:hypothetical protein